MPPANTGSFSNHLAPGLVGIIGTELQEQGRKSYYSQFTDEETGPERNYFDYLAASGLPMARLKLENDPIQSVDPLEGTTKRVSYDEWALGFEVTQIAWEDDLYKTKGSALRRAAASLSSSLMERREVEAHRPLGAEGLTATYGVLPDNSTFFSTSHAAITGGEAGVQANRPSTDVALSVTSYRAGRTSFMRYTDDRGNRIPAYTRPVRLIVPPDLADAAAEIINSSNRPDTANLVENVNRGEVSILVTPYLTDTNNWILQGSRHFLKFFRRTKPRFDNFDDRRRRTAIFVAWERYKVVPIHWLGHYGSFPA